MNLRNSPYLNETKRIYEITIIDDKEHVLKHMAIKNLPYCNKEKIPENTASSYSNSREGSHDQNLSCFHYEKLSKNITYPYSDRGECSHDHVFHDKSMRNYSALALSDYFLPIPDD